MSFTVSFNYFLVRISFTLMMYLVSIRISPLHVIGILPNQRIVFFARSDWLHKLGIVCAIHLPAFGFCARVFPRFSEIKKLFGTGYPLVWCLVQCRWSVVDIYPPVWQLGKYPPLFTSTSVNNCLLHVQQYQISQSWENAGVTLWWTSSVLKGTFSRPWWTTQFVQWNRLQRRYIAS